MSAVPVQFEAEHLLNVEISVCGETIVTNPEEAVIRLHQLDLTKCLSPVKVLLRLEVQEFSIIDQKAGYALERIPYSSITPHPEPFVRSVNDRFPNLAILTIRDSFDIAPPEFYVFQFANTSNVAKVFIQKIADFKESGKMLQNKNKPAVPTKPARNDVSKAIEDQAQRTAQATLHYKKPPNQPPLGSLDAPRTHSPSIDAQQLDKYLELLNRCLDDIEGFVVRLQLAAKAYQDLEERRRSGQEVRDREEGMLIMSARPPPPKDYFDIFQKIKLTFNLLAKLKGSIKNPTAAEMVHYIFNPMDLIVEASCAILGPDDQPLWEHVLSPLLIPEAVTFLEDCLVTKEIELWRSLGSTWNISSTERDFWLSCVQEVPMYVPVFNDGWSPPTSLLTEISPKLDPRDTQHLLRVKPQRASNYGPDFNEQQQRQSMNSSPFRPIDDQHLGAVSRRSNSPQLNRFSGVPNPGRSPPHAGGRQQAHSKVEDQKEFVSGLLAKGSKIYIATCDRPAENNMELSITKGQAFELLETSRFHLKVRSYNQIIGYVPTSALAPLTAGPDNNGFIQDQTNRNSGLDGWTNADKNKTTIDNLNEEFQMKMKTDPDPSKKKNLSKSSSGAITEKSSPEEVATWLAQKGFNASIQSSLANFGGKQLFVMDRTVLERLFGYDAGSKLYNQILLQRNLCGYKTLRAKELQSILEDRKRKADSIIVSDLFRSGDQAQQLHFPALVSEHF